MILPILLFIIGITISRIGYINLFGTEHKLVLSPFKSAKAKPVRSTVKAKPLEPWQNPMGSMVELKEWAEARAVALHNANETRYPSGILLMDSILNEDEMEALKERFRKEHAKGIVGGLTSEFSILYHRIDDVDIRIDIIKRHPEAPDSEKILIKLQEERLRLVSRISKVSKELHHINQDQIDDLQSAAKALTSIDLARVFTQNTYPDPDLPTYVDSEGDILRYDHRSLPASSGHAYERYTPGIGLIKADAPWKLDRIEEIVKDKARRTI
jgi:hypothetical protein